VMLNPIWEDAVTMAISKWPTPFYLSSWNPVLNALDELKVLESCLPIRHWLSFKTHPVKKKKKKWLTTTHGIEVVSEYEFLAAINEGFPPERILVNGVAKQSWLPNYSYKYIKVHFDSAQEAGLLADQAKDCEWRTGIRLHVNEEYDPDEPQFQGQFGLDEAEAKLIIKKLRSAGVLLESVHFHLRSNVSVATSYKLAIEAVARVCKDSNFCPTYLDCGGGLPVPGIRALDHKADSQKFSLLELSHILSDIPTLIPSVREVWLENGRFLTARSAVLVTRVLDIKERSDSRYLICDGGRTNHALVSDWETHDVFTIPYKVGSTCLTTVCGPTCMAYDRLIRKNLPKDINVGDYVIWMDAGAYHIPWETRFSHGLASVVWCDEDGALSSARGKETFPEWWGRWR